MDVRLIATSFNEIWPYAVEFAEDFYRRLFLANPEFEALFEPDRMARQYRKMISALDLVIGQAESGDIDEAIADISSRCVPTKSSRRYANAWRPMRRRSASGWAACSTRPRLTPILR